MTFPYFQPVKPLPIKPEKPKRKKKTKKGSRSKPDGMDDVNKNHPWLKKFLGV